MKLRYYSNFKSITNKEYRLEVYTQSDVVAEPLLLSSSPMQVEYESDELYKPLKLSNAIIEVLTGKVLTDLYTGENHGVEVRLYNLSDNIIEWFGYLTPNLYTSDYVTILDNLSLEAIDSIASLDNMKYTYVNENDSFSAMFDILVHILNEADPHLIAPYVYIQKTCRLYKDSSSCLLSDVYIQERNFFDEANEPITFREALEYMATYFGMTVVQWKDGYYMVDYDYVNRGSAEFFIYDRSTKELTTKNMQEPVCTIRDIGITSGSASISLGNVYNKVSVVANLNVINDVIPDAFDSKDIINQNSDQLKYYEKRETIDGKVNVLLSSFWKSNKNYLYKVPCSNMDFVAEEIKEVTIDNYTNIASGVYWQKCDSYLYDNGEPSSLNWKDYLTFAHTNTFFKPDITLLSLNAKGVVLFRGGVLIANISYKLSKHLLAHDALKTSNEIYSNTMFGAGFKNTMFPCRLSIGGYYYDGEGWVGYNDFLLKTKRGYFKVIIGHGHIAGAKWYRYKDDYGYWRWVTEVTYNSLNGVEKMSGDCEQNNMHYFTENGKNIFVEEWYNNECFLMDRFYLVHKNKENDRVFDTQNELTNTVSYKMNLVDSQDGVAIRLPNDLVLTGILTFELCMPNHLGTIPMYRTDMPCSMCNAVHISDMSLVYSSENEKVDIYNLSNKDNLDVVYSNVISDNNITEMNDVDLFINTNVRNIASYSNAATKTCDNFDYLKGVYSPFEDGIFLPERLLVDKLYRHYSVPKFQYSNELKRNLSILSRVKENSLNKTMVVNCMSIDYVNESNCVQLIEV